jgi:hypothetical protein
MKQLDQAHQRFEASLRRELQYLDDEIRLLSSRQQAVLTVLQTQFYNDLYVNWDAGSDVENVTNNIPLNLPALDPPASHQPTLFLVQ